MAMGWQLGRWQAAAERNDLRQDLMREMALNQEKLRECQLNMANQFTPGFKTSLPIFWENGRPVLNVAQGEIFRTQTSTNLAINGPGFFLVGDPARPVLTRDGRFNSRLEDEQGRRLLGFSGSEEKLVPCPLLGADQTVRVDEFGRVWGETSRWDPALTRVVVTKSSPGFQLALAQVAHPEHLARFGTTGLVPTTASGEMRTATLEVWQNAVLVPGSVELANVDFYQQGTMIAALRNQAGMLGMAPPPSLPPGPAAVFPTGPPAMMLPGQDPLKLR